MLYIQCCGDPKNEDILKKFENLGRKGEREIQDATKKQFVNGNDFFFLSKVEDAIFEIGAFVERIDGFEKKLNRFLSNIGLELINIDYEEVVFSVIDDMLDTAEMFNFVRRIGLGFPGFDKIRRMMRRDECEETIIEKNAKLPIYGAAEQLCVRNSLLEELERIYQGKKNKRVPGHPVHYMIQTDDKESAENAVEVLVQALYENDRIESRRVTMVSIDEMEFGFNRIAIDEVFANGAGTTLVIDYQGGEEEEGSLASASRDLIERICNAIKRYRNSVLTVLRLPKACTRLKEWFFEYLGGISIVEINEDFVSGSEAKQILKKKARMMHVYPDQQLIGSIREEENYLLRDLNGNFEDWFGEKLKRSIYPQYQAFHSVRKKEGEETPKGSAYEDLERMIGLTEAKKVVRQALDYYKARKIFREKGMMQNTPSMHMVFTGNPGTAKTSVARLFARIMKDNGILSTGQLVEVGRGDLVGKFVGWTAPTVKKKFSEAKGGVLFIDEAYSLVDDRDGLYGDEAINTIVQEMENHREEVVVIFAGYPDKMEQFLQKNPGLRSRIAFHVPFEDYNADELCDIATLLADKCGMRFTEDAYDKLRQNFEIAMEQSDFGNGRYVRNVIEKARMAQSSRLLSMDIDRITGEDVATLCGEDIEVPEVEEKNTVIKFGFCG